MFQFDEITVDCKKNGKNYIKKNYTIVNCTLNRNTDIYIELKDKAAGLASSVNTHAANDSAQIRSGSRLTADSFGGILAEKGWENYLNRTFGQIASPTEFTDASRQIDIRLNNGELIEVRSSFVRNGVIFAICNDKTNFKNIGPYSNTIKPGEMQKDLYLTVLFATDKNKLLSDDIIRFSLIGGSDWNMMMNPTLSINGHLDDKDSPGIEPGDYRFIYLKNALDVRGIENWLLARGYRKNAR
jgi:hypothetical protein